MFGGPANPKKAKQDKHVHIATIYDDRHLTDPDETLLRRSEPYHLKYRGSANLKGWGVQFTKSTDTTN